MHKPYAPAVHKALDELLKSGEIVLKKDVGELIETEVKNSLTTLKKLDKEKIFAMKIKSVKSNSRLTDDDFIIRLLTFNIPIKFMAQFRDEDNILSRDQLWQFLRDNKLKA